MVNQLLDLSLRFRYFFVRKLVGIRYASAFVVFPGGFSGSRRTFRGPDPDQTGDSALPRCVGWLPALERPGDLDPCPSA